MTDMQSRTLDRDAFVAALERSEFSVPPEALAGAFRIAVWLRDCAGAVGAAARQPENETAGQGGDEPR